MDTLRDFIIALADYTGGRVNELKDKELRALSNKQLEQEIAFSVAREEMFALNAWLEERIKETE